MQFGPGLIPPSKKTLRIERVKYGPKMFEADEIRKLVNGATIDKVIIKPTTSLRAMILLGVNCGFGNTDCDSLARSALDHTHRQDLLVGRGEIRTISETSQADPALHSMGGRRHPRVNQVSV
jgi:hypothetical protein